MESKSTYNSKIKILNYEECIKLNTKDIQDFIYINIHSDLIDIHSYLIDMSRYIKVKRFGISFVKYTQNKSI